jgi:Domain of unknown function (DUF4157)
VFSATRREGSENAGAARVPTGPTAKPPEHQGFNPLWGQLATQVQLKPAAGAREVPHRARMEATFGEEFSGVRAYLGRGAALDSMGASAAAEGESVAFASESPSPGRVAHELAHVVQGWRAGAGTLTGRRERSRKGDASEREADRAGVAATTGARAHVSQVPSAALSLSARNPFDDAAAWKDAAGATAALEAYKVLPEADRRAAVATSYKKDLIRVLASLAPADKVGKYVDPIREITRWVEEEETRASSGMTDDMIAAEQAKFMRKEAEDAAKAAAALKAPKGPPPPPPTPGEIEAERKKQVAGTSITAPTVSGWDALPAADKTTWTTRGNTAIAKVVTLVSGKYPELGISAAKFRLAFKDVEARGLNVVAFGESDGAGGKRAAVGFSFTTAVELDPAYVIDVVVHEVFGHREYGEYGTEYHLKLYDLAAAKMPGYVKPAAGTPDRTTETDAYAYQETEIYAVLRSMAYRTAPTPADASKVPNLDTQTIVTWHVSLMKKQWAPTLIVAILRGLRTRLLIDPRITGVALAVFDNAVAANFAAATAALITA